VLLAGLVSELFKGNFSVLVHIIHSDVFNSLLGMVIKVFLINKSVAVVVKFVEIIAIVIAICLVLLKVDLSVKIGVILIT
jgi:hypothetical protein